MLIVTNPKTELFKVYQKTKTGRTELCKVKFHHKGFSIYDTKIHTENGLKYYEHMITETVDTSITDWNKMQQRTELAFTTIHNISNDGITELVDIIMMEATKQYSNWKKSSEKESKKEAIVAKI
jgi:hypothetical protein